VALVTIGIPLPLRRMPVPLTQGGAHVHEDVTVQGNRGKGQGKASHEIPLMARL
jgi:hypothetical protein